MRRLDALRGLALTLAFAATGGRLDEHDRFWLTRTVRKLLRELRRPTGLQLRQLWRVRWLR